MHAIRLLLVLLAASLFGGVCFAAESPSAAAENEAGNNGAIASFQGLSGEEVSGKVILEPVEEGALQISGAVRGLTPGLHGFHIHTYGRCDDDKGKTAGGHFSPSDTKHGGPNDAVKHAGDLGNIEVNDDGVAFINLKSSKLSLEGENSVLGRSIIIHAKADDFRSQPSGAAGDRIGCAVIGVAALDKAATDSSSEKS